MYKKLHLLYLKLSETLTGPSNAVFFTKMVNQGSAASGG